MLDIGDLMDFADIVDIVDIVVRVDCLYQPGILVYCPRGLVPGHDLDCQTRCLDQLAVCRDCCCPLAAYSVAD